MSVKKISSVEEIEPVISVLSSAFVDDPSTASLNPCSVVVTRLLRKDSQAPYAVRCLFEQMVPTCVTDDTNVQINNNENATIIWFVKTA